MAKLTIREYLNKNFDSNKKQEYISRYNAIKSSIHIKWFKLADNGHLIMHFKVPSEKSKNIMYDTLIEFCTNSNTPYALNNCDIKVFSNCPSYVFMNARFASINSLSIKWAEPLFSKDTLKLPDPKELESKPLPTDIRIEKGLFFPIYHISKMSNIELMAYTQKAPKISNGEMITAFIRNQDWVMEKRGKVGAEFKFDKLFKQMGISKQKESKDSKYVKKTNSVYKNGKIPKITRTGRTKKI